MRLFLVWDSEGISKTTDTVVEDLFEAFDCDTDDEGPRRRSRGSTKRKKELVSEDEVEESVDGDSGSGESSKSGKKASQTRFSKYPVFYLCLK